MNYQNTEKCPKNQIWWILDALQQEKLHITEYKESDHKSYQASFIESLYHSGAKRQFDLPLTMFICHNFNTYYCIVQNRKTQQK